MALRQNNGGGAYAAAGYETQHLLPPVKGGGLMKWAVLGFVVTLVILCGTDTVENA